jgi:hypothetical protein
MYRTATEAAAMPDRSDDEARSVWGAAYEAIPKSIFALVAWQLANRGARNHDGHALGYGEVVDALNALAAEGIITAEQHGASIAAILREMGR